MFQHFVIGQHIYVVDPYIVKRICGIKGAVISIVDDENGGAGGDC